MTKIKFLLASMAFLKYYMPIIIELNNNSIESIIYYRKGNCKSNTDKQCSLLSFSTLKKYSDLYSFVIKPISEFINEKCIVFDIEASSISSINLTNKQFKLISIVHVADYTVLFPKYCDIIDYCIFINKNFVYEYAKAYNINLYKALIKYDHKCLYLGSPKFDFSYDKNTILTKYKLDKNKKYIFMFLPCTFGKHYITINIVCDIINFFGSKGYFIIGKTRNKDDYSNTNDFPKNMIYVNDIDWFPHPSLELIYISDFVFNFNSTGFEESIILNKQIINYHKFVKKFNLLEKNFEASAYFDFFSSICNFNYDIDDIKDLENAYRKLMENNHLSLENVKKTYFSVENSTPKIIKLIKSLM